MAEKVLIIMNPCSGTMKANKYLTDIVNIFTVNDYVSTVLTTTKRGDGRIYAKNYAKKVDLIVCIGGDGTFNEVVSGVIQSRNFSYVASFGAFTKTSYATPQNVKNALGHLAYVLGGINSIASIRAEHMAFEVNGMKYEDDYIFGAISNSTSLGQNASFFLIFFGRFFALSILA